MNKRKKNILPIILLVIMVIGITIAYFRSSLKFNKSIGSKVFKATYTSVLDTPESWLPGDTTTGDFTVRNDSNVDVAVRAKIDESWIDSNGDTLPNKYDNQDVISLNFGGGWTSHTDGYYYYYQSLKPGDETNSLIDLVTFNDIFGRKAICTDSATDSDVATCVKGGAYGAGTYSLKVTFEVIQSDVYESEWHISAEDRMYPVTVSFDANGGVVSESNRTVYLGGTYGSLPTPTREGYTFKGWNGKNLLNSEKLSDDSIYTGTKWIGYANALAYTDYLKPNTDYTISLYKNGYGVDARWAYRLFYNDNDLIMLQNASASLGIVTNRDFSTTFTTNNTGEIVYAEIYGDLADRMPLWFNTVYLQLEEGNSATAYEPYYIKTDTEVVQSGSHTLKAIWEAE